MQLIVRRIIITIFVVLVLLLITLWGIAPLVAQKVLEDFFAQHEAEFVAESISINPFTATITAHNIDVTSKRGREFKFDSFLIELDILPLFEHKARVSHIELNGLHLEIMQQADGWRIAGVLLPEEEPTGETEPAEPPPASLQEAWEVQLPSVLLSEATINVSRPGSDNNEPLQDAIKINRLFISKIEGRGPDWRGDATLSAAINGATADLTTEFRYQDGDLTQYVDIQLITAALSQFKHYVPSPFNQGNVNLSLIGEVVVNYKSTGTTLTASTKRFELDRVSLPLDQFSLESERTQATIDNLQVVLPTGADPSVLFEGQLSSIKSRITTDQERKLIASWDELTVKPVSLRLENNIPAVNIAKLEVKQLTASQNSAEGNALPALATMQDLAIEDIQVTDKNAKVDVIEVADLNLQLHLDNTRQLTNLISLSPASPAQNADADKVADNDPASSPPASPPATSGEPGKPFAVVVNRFSVSGESLLDFSDQGVTPPFSQQITINTLEVEGLNTADPDQSMHVVFEGKTDKYSVVKTDTRMWPFKEKLTVDTRTEIQEINLNPVSPYVAEALGYDIESGQLDMNVTINIDQGVMNGQTKMNLRRFDLGGTDTPEKQVKEGSTKGLSGAIPLNIAVGMLKDSNENIELDIPVTGDVNSPKFGWGSFVSLLFKNALFEATAGIVVQSFVPYANVLTIAKIAGDQLLKVRVDPLNYPPKSIDPAEANPAFVDEFKKLMTDKTEMQVKACPIATPQDLEGEIPAELSAEQIAQLNVIAANRGEAFKDAIIAGGKIKSSRILLCKPKVDLEKTAQGRLEFEI